MILGILLAAGASRRFGPADKLLSDWQGSPLLSHAATSLASAGCDAVMAVTSSEVVARILPPAFLPCPIAAGQPMSASWEAGVREAERLGARYLLFMLGDMPNISADLLRRLTDRAREGQESACQMNGRRLPPACFSLASCLSLLPFPPGDQGARPLMAGLSADKLISLSAAEGFDLDLPGDAFRTDR